MSDVLLMVGTTKGLFFYRADERRGDWALSGPHLGGWEVSAVAAIGAPGARRILLGTTHYAYRATLRASDDLGASWTELEGRPTYPRETGFELKRIWQLQTDIREPDTVYAGIDEAGLFVSHDRGDTWMELDALTRQPGRKQWFPGAGGLCLHTIVQDRSNPRRFWVGISAVGCFRTDDAGATWVNCNHGLPQLPTGASDGGVACCVHKLVQHPTRPDTLFMQFHGGVMRSDDGADSWRRVEAGLPSNFGFPMVITARGEICIAPLDSDERRYFRDGRFAIYRSQDEGASWQAVTSGLPAEPSFVGVLRDAMTTDDAEPTGVYFGTTMGECFASRDAGRSFERLPGTLPRVLMMKTMRV